VNTKSVALYNKALENIKANNLNQAKRNLEKSIQLSPDFFQALNSLGTVFERQGLYTKALNFYQKANQLLPDNPIILNNIGNAFSKLKKTENAIDSYRNALRADPNFSNAAISLLTALIRSNQLSASYTFVTSKKENLSLFLILISIFLHLVKDTESEKYLIIKENGLSLSKLYARSNSNKATLTNILTNARLGFCSFHTLLVHLTHQYEDCYLTFADFLLDIIAHLDECKSISAYFYSFQHLRSGQLESALVYIEKAINYDCPDILKAPIIDILFGLNRPDEAYEHLQKLHGKILPSPVTASLFFRHNDLKKGWDDYLQTEYTFNHVTQNLQSLADFEGKSILILTGQGIGDVIMFLSCLDDFIIQTKIKKITINCDARLHSLINRSFPDVSVMWDKKLWDPRFINKDYGDLDSFDICIKLSSICNLTRQHIENFYPQKRYLTPVKDLISTCGKRISQLSNPISIGFAWRGGSIKNRINNKNIDLIDFLPLFKLPNINWINLQYGNVKDDISKFNAEFHTNLIHFEDINPIEEIETQYALIANLDLVIQTSNTSIHFAGSQGIPTWVMITEPSDFRWFDGKDTDMSPWYENMRVCRKAPELQWSDYIANLAKELQVKLDSLK